METDRHNKARITRVAGILRTLSFIVLVGWALMFVALIMPEILMHSLADDRTYRAYFLFGNLFFVFGFIVTFHFFRFFARLRAGHLFDAKTVGHLHSAGRWWLGAWVFGMGLTYLGRRSGMTQLQFTFDGLLAACTVLFAAWLFREAQLIQQENELTV